MLLNGNSNVLFKKGALWSLGRDEMLRYEAEYVE
jgi:hypothetical protein